MFDDGRNSLVSSAMYNQIKTLLHLEKNGRGQLSATDSMMVNSMNDQNTENNYYILKGFLGLLMTLLF